MTLIKISMACLPLHLQMVVILQPASRRPFRMLPVTIFTAMTNDCQQDAKAPSLVNQVTSCLFRFVVEFANNGFNLGGGGGGGGDSSTKKYQE